MGDDVRRGLIRQDRHSPFPGHRSYGDRSGFRFSIVLTVVVVSSHCITDLKLQPSQSRGSTEPFQLLACHREHNRDRSCT